eukprot:1497831-Prymnesium_polylepis.1
MLHGSAWIAPSLVVMRVREAGLRLRRRHAGRSSCVARSFQRVVSKNLTVTPSRRVALLNRFAARLGFSPSACIGASRYALLCCAVAS